MENEGKRKKKSWRRENVWVRSQTEAEKVKKIWFGKGKVLTVRLEDGGP